MGKVIDKIIFSHKMFICQPIFKMCVDLLGYKLMMVKDCQFGVSPVNYSDSDSDSDDKITFCSGCFRTR